MLKRIAVNRSELLTARNVSAILHVEHEHSRTVKRVRPMDVPEREGRLTIQQEKLKYGFLTPESFRGFLFETVAGTEQLIHADYL